jgi:uncharacterized membrane protein HdeD (DUF308 family)
MKKYKWLYLWVTAVALLVFASLVLINAEFGKSVIYYVTGALLVVFVIIRFIPLIKTTRNNWAIAINAIEMFIDLLVGILMIYLTANVENKEVLYKCYPFLVGGVIYARGSVYFAEVAFFNTKVETSKFFVSLALITAGAVIMGRFDNFNVNSIRWILGIAFAICGIVAVGDGYINYNNYRKLYVMPKKEKEKVKKIEQKIEVPALDTEIIIDENGSKPQEYVN